MKRLTESGPLPDVSAFDKREYVAVFLDKKGFIEKTLRETSSSFGKTLDQAAKDVNVLQSEAGKVADKLTLGKKVDLQDVMAAVDKAKTSFDQLTEIRNKMIEAYREILRMRIK